MASFETNRQINQTYASSFLLQISLTMSESRSLVVLYGSQTGTAQEVAERVGRSVQWSMVYRQSH